MPEDPYADPATGALRNKLGLSATGELETAEREITHAALIFLRESPVNPTYDLAHLCAIHRRVFGDIYDWAGQLRTVAIAKGTWFCLPQYIESAAADVFRALHGESFLRGLPRDVFTERLTHYLGEDEQIGQMLDKLDELGIADNTFVMYSTDNGPENDTWPDGANTPFRSQKDTNWEGAWRVPSFIRWPGKIKAGTVLNGIVSHQDMLPTLLALAGDPDVSQKLLNGYKIGDKTFKVHIDGVNVLPYLTGQVKESPREAFFYVSDDGGVMAVRAGDYKLVFEEQRATSTAVWQEPMVKLRLPYIFNLRRDPFERANVNSNVYWDWMINHVPQLYQCQALVAAQIDNYVKYPPRQKAASFNLDSVMAQLGPAIAAYKKKEAAAERQPTSAAAD